MLMANVEAVAVNIPDQLKDIRHLLTSSLPSHPKVLSCYYPWVGLMLGVQSRISHRLPPCHLSLQMMATCHFNPIHDAPFDVKNQHFSFVAIEGSGLLSKEDNNMPSHCHWWGNVHVALFCSLYTMS